jgi:hypothetical protein
MNALRLAATVVVLTAASAGAAPTCKDRVAALKALSARLQPELGAWTRGPVEQAFSPFFLPSGKAAQRPEWKTRGLRLMATLDDSIDEADEPGLARDLLGLAHEGKVELCVAKNAPVKQQVSRDADPKLLAPLLAELGALEAADRATMLAGRVKESTWSCRGILGSFEAVAYVAPSDRLAILGKSIAESLEACGCPAAEAERIYVYLALMADVWRDEVVCAPLLVGAAPQAKAVRFVGPVMEIVNALAAAGPNGVSLPKALPSKPAKAR